MTGRRRRALSLLAAAALAVAVGLTFLAIDALPGVERAAVDARFDLRGKQDPRTDIVIVALDDRSVAAAEEGFPVSRQRHADVVTNLTKAGAGVIAHDFQFTEPSDDPEADDNLGFAIQDASNVVLGTTEIAPDGSTGIFGGAEILEIIGATPASTLFPNDEDGRNRHMEFETSNLETFAVAAARLKLGRQPALPAGNLAWVDFPGPARTFRTLSFADVEQGRFDAADVRGKIVVVGATAAVAKDFHRTSVGELSGPEVQAGAIATVLDGFPLEDADRWLELLLIVALALVGPLVAWRFGAVVALTATFVAAAASLVAAQLLFNAGTIVAVVPPLAAAAVGAVGAAAFSNPERSALDALLDRLTRGVKGNQRTRRLRALLLLCAACVVAVTALVLQGTTALDRLELGTVDTRFDVRGTDPIPSDIVVVGIDDKTFTEPPDPRYPFPHSHHARVVRHLAEAGAKVIAYDIQFSELDPNDPKGTEQLVEATRAAGNVVVSTTEVDEAGRPNAFFFDIPTTDIVPEELLAYSRAMTGNGNVVNDADGRNRRMRFRIQNEDAFPVVAAGVARGGPIDLPTGSEAWVDYVGPPQSMKYLSFVDVRRGTFNPADVRGKVVVIGGVAPSLQDLHDTATSGSGKMPGPEIHANAIHTALRGFPLKSGPTWLDWLLVIALSVLTPFIALRRGIVVPAVIGVVALGALLVGAQFAFNSGTIVSVVYPLIAGIAAILASAGIHGLTVAFEREQARDAFARFVPEAVVDQVLADSDGVRLGGVRREGTVMFSDLRGFTSFSETLEPERVIESLNRYLTEMSEAILNHGGTLVAYMGDGIMAVFGAPLIQDDHADRALEASREMLERLEGFNQWLRDEELHDGFKMGIGLNSGPVMSGNVGSERRLEYTALGDTTNTAARLEGMTKGTPHQLYISDTTKQRLIRPADDLVQVGEAEVRGRKAKVLLWSLREGPAPEPEPSEPETVEA